MNREPIKLTVAYYGHFRMKVENPYEMLEVSSNPEEGMEQIKAYLSTKYGINSGYMTRINNDSMIRYLRNNTNATLSGNDIIKIIPVASGG